MSKADAYSYKIRYLNASKRTKSEESSSSTDSDTDQEDQEDFEFYDALESLQEKAFTKLDELLPIPFE